MIRLEIICGASLQGKRFPLIIIPTQSVQDVSRMIANKLHLKSMKNLRLFIRGVEYACSLSTAMSELVQGEDAVYVLGMGEPYQGPSADTWQRGTSDVSVIASPEVYIDSEAVDQVISLVKASRGSILRAVCMPDLHHGPTGVAILASKPLPKLPGYDIGCGMALFATGIPFDIRLGEVIRRMSTMNIDVGEIPDDPQLGTIGGGNHFAELLRVDESVSVAPEILELLDPSVLYLLVHSGSRSHGERVFSEYSDGHDPEGYMLHHTHLCEWARQNRKEIARRFLNQFCGDCNQAMSDPIVDITHNWIERMPDETYLHRKGAAPAYAGTLSLLPGSRGTASYILLSRGSEESLFSMAHGAGRKLSRSDAKKRCEGTRDDLTRGGTVICNDRSLLREEAPEAYKDVEAVVRCMSSRAYAVLVLGFCQWPHIKLLETRSVKRKTFYKMNFMLLRF